MGKSHFRKIVKDRLEKEQYSLNLPLEVIQELNLVDSMVEIKIKDGVGTFRKIGETKKEKTEVTDDKDDIF
jgi:hypothetical protein